MTLLTRTIVCHPKATEVFFSLVAESLAPSDDPTSVGHFRCVAGGGGWMSQVSQEQEQIVGCGGDSSGNTAPATYETGRHQQYLLLLLALRCVREASATSYDGTQRTVASEGKGGGGGGSLSWIPSYLG